MTKEQQDALVNAMEGIVHFGDALNYREDTLSVALRQWIHAGETILADIHAGTSGETTPPNRTDDGEDG